MILTNLIRTVEATCGDLVSEQFAYFRNPSYPKVNSQPSFCGLRIQKHQSNICQLKLEFQQLQLAPPNYGNCSQDLFFVTGQNGNNRVPRICGQNDGQHCTSLHRQYLLVLKINFNWSLCSFRLFTNRWIGRDQFACANAKHFRSEIQHPRSTDRLRKRRFR